VTAPAAQGAGPDHIRLTFVSAGEIATVWVAKVFARFFQKALLGFFLTRW